MARSKPRVSGEVGAAPAAAARAKMATFLWPRRMAVGEAVGIRDLRDRLTRWVGKVRRGHRVVVTDRGRPVAELVPFHRGKPPDRAARLTALLTGGHVSPAERPFPKRPRSVRGTGQRPSDIIAKSRR